MSDHDEAIAPRASYSLPELAALLGMSRWRLRRLLEQRGVELERSGRLRVVELARLHQAAPELWARVVGGVR